MAITLLFVRSVLYALVFYTLTIPWVIICSLASLINQRLMIVLVQIWGWMHRITSRVILGQRIEIIGTLPTEPGLVILKHESMFETIDVLCMFVAPVVAAKQELLDIPGWGWIARRFGVIGIQRTAGAKALRVLQKQALASVAAGRPVLLFPEGTRVPHGQRAPIRAGFAALYQLLKLPVTPIAVNSGILSPRGSFLKRPGVITYKVGETIPPGLPRAEAEAKVLDAINALNPPPNGHGL